MQYKHHNPISIRSIVIVFSHLCLDLLPYGFPAKTLHAFPAHRIRFAFFIRFPALPDVEGLEQGPISLVSTTGKLFERKSIGSGLENRD
jgi:hypothetical protein